LAENAQFLVIFATAAGLKQMHDLLHALPVRKLFRERNQFAELVSRHHRHLPCERTISILMSASTDFQLEEPSSLIGMGRVLRRCKTVEPTLILWTESDDRRQWWSMPH
jgi:hypothetical protein